MIAAYILAKMCAAFSEGLFNEAEIVFEQEKVFQISGVILAIEQSIKSFSFIFLGFCLYFKSTFTIKKSMNDFWNHFSRTANNGCFCWYILYRN